MTDRPEPRRLVFLALGTLLPALGAGVAAGLLAGAPVGLVVGA